MTPGGGAKAPYAHSLESSGYGQSLYSQFVGLPLQMYQSFTPAHPSSVARKLSLKFQGLDGQAAMHSPTDFGSRVGSGNNAVDLQRIRQGRDVRTTVRFKVSLTERLLIPKDNAPKHSKQDASGEGQIPRL